MKEFCLFCDQKLSGKSMPYGLANQAFDLQKYRTTIDKKFPLILTEITYKKMPSQKITKQATKKSLLKINYPKELIQDFIKKAEINTRQSIETCGILCGVKRDSYYIRNIFIPSQKGTQDLCITTNYEEIDQYITKHELLTLGWIHTHPDYTSFLSSIDIHTQYGYQQLLPEAIAVVYSGLASPRSEK